jgi:hypothetical protein
VLKGKGNGILKPAIPLKARKHQLRERLGPHRYPVNFDCRELLKSNLIDLAVDGD